MTHRCARHPWPKTRIAARRAPCLRTDRPRTRPRTGRCTSSSSTRNCPTRRLGQAHPHAQPDAAPGAPAPPDLPLPPQRRRRRRPARPQRFFADHGIRTVVVDRAVPPKSGPAFYARLAANLLSPLPYSVASHTSRAAAAGARRARRARAGRPVALRVDALRRRRCAASPAARVVMAHNVESVIWQRYHETETNPLKRWYIGQQWRKFERFERTRLAAADRTVAVSDAGRRAASATSSASARRRGGQRRRYRLLPARPTARATRRRLLFLGSLDWRPNLDGVAQLLDRVFPAVRAAEPRRTLAARRPQPAGRGCAGASPPTPGVELHANVPDVRPFLAACGVLVVPLRIGGGSRLKILEALASGLPVVSTRVGAEGLHLEPGRHLDRRRGRRRPGRRAAAPRIREPDAAAGAGRARAASRCCDRYDWDVLADRLEQRVAASVPTDAPRHRGGSRA